MIEIEGVVASGSNGNCTIIRDADGENVLLDMGISTRRLYDVAYLESRNVDSVLITHEHSDHATISAIKRLVSDGATVYATYGTLFRTNLLNYRDQHIQVLKPGEKTKINRLCVTPIDVTHDAAEPVAFRITDSDDALLYLTDAKDIPDFKRWTFTKILIEANYSPVLMAQAPTEDWLKERIINNHLSIDQVCDFLKKPKTTKRLKEVHLMHISQKHGNAELFKEMVTEQLKNLGLDIRVYAHD